MQQVALLVQAEVSQIKLIRAFENFVYEFPQGAAYRILRITHSSHRSLAQVLSELHFLNYLGVNGVNAANVIHNSKGELASCIKATDGSYFVVSVFTKANGVGAEEFEFTPEVLQDWGRTMGKMHALSKNYKPSTEIIPRYQWFDDPLVNNGLHNKRLNSEAILRLAELNDAIKALPNNKDTFGLIHSDLHQGNFFVCQNQITAFDFDDCCYQYFIHDIAISLYYAFKKGYTGMDKKTFATHFLKYFIQGYQMENTLPNDWIKQLPLFFELRHFVLHEVLTQKLDIENATQPYLDMVARMQMLACGEVPFLEFSLEEVWP